MERLKSTIQSLPSELITYIITEYKEKNRINRPELRVLGSVCRSFCYAVLLYLGQHVAFLRRDTSCSCFVAFTAFIEAHPSYARYTRHLTVDPPREESDVPPKTLLPTSFTALESLKLANAYFISTISKIPTDSPPFPNLGNIYFTRSRTDPTLEVSIDAILPFWRSPKLHFVRLIRMYFVPDTSRRVENLLQLTSIAEISLIDCKISDRSLRQLTTVRAIDKLRLNRTNLGSLEIAIPRVYEVDVYSLPRSGEYVPLHQFIDLKRLSLTETQLREVQTGSQKLPSCILELEPKVDVVNTGREIFLKEVHKALEEMFPSLSVFEIVLEGTIPLDENATHRYSEDDSDDDDNESESSDEKPEPVECNQGDLMTGYPRLGYHTLGRLELCEPTSTSAINEDADYKNFAGYKRLKDVCEHRRITLNCEWTVRGE